jgi:hypothetical protein
MFKAVGLENQIFENPKSFGDEILYKKLIVYGMARIINQIIKE